MSKKNANIALGIGALSIFMGSRQRGSRFDMRTMDQIESQRQEKEFVPFYIILSQSFRSFGLVGERVNSREIEKDKKIVFGPFKQKDANQAMQSLAVFFRSFGSGRTFKSKNYDGEINQNMIDQYFEFFDNTKMWSGPNDYNPYLNIAPSRTSHVQRGPDKGKTYTREWISILENSHIDGRSGFGDKDTMANMTFEMWTWSPNYKKEGNEFYQTYGRPEEKRTPIPIYPPVMFQMWQTYLLSELAQLYTFPSFNQGSLNIPLQGQSMPYSFLVERGRAYRYYDDGVSEVAHGISEGNLDAIKIAGDFLAKQVTSNDILVPMPSRYGFANTTMILANYISEISGAKIVNCLVGSERESIYTTKKQDRSEKQVDLGLDFICETPKHSTLFIVDNVIGTGYTMGAAQRLLPNSEPLVYAVDVECQ